MNLNVLLILSLVFTHVVYAEVAPAGFKEGTYAGESTCQLIKDPYKCKTRYTFTKYSLTEEYQCTNGQAGVDDIEFQLNKSNGELEFPMSPNFKLKCDNHECVIINSDAPEFADKYKFIGNQLFTSSTCESYSGEKAINEGTFTKVP